MSLARCHNIRGEGFGTRTAVTSLIYATVSCPSPIKYCQHCSHDLEQRNLLVKTLVVGTGEFGRTPRVGQRNSDAGAGRDGRDHRPNGFTTVLAGGGMRGGIVYGSCDPCAAYPATDRVPPVDLIASVYHALGVPRDLVYHDRLGRELIICLGNPVMDLLM